MIIEGRACTATIGAVVRLVFVLSSFLGPWACDAGKTATSPPANEVVIARRDTIPTDPADAAWAGAPVFVAPLVLQDMVEPRLMSPSTPQVRVQAVSDGKKVAFRLEWDDASADNLPHPGSFPDACAVQVPTRIERDVPAPQMGETGRPVEITYWRASWQALADGRTDTLQALYPGASVDHYPFEAPPLHEGSPDQRQFARMYAPAIAAGNLMASPGAQPVQALVAEGPGTLHPAEHSEVSGRGVRTASGWIVVLVRPLPEGLAPDKRSVVAFAVWEGAKAEVGARKMRSVWVPLSSERGP